MCFSPTASFTAAAGLAVIGVATLSQVREPRALLFAATPLLFALHQGIEGIVWLGLDGRLSPASAHQAGFLFMLYAQGILPFLMPAAVALMEPEGWRRKVIGALAGAGAVVCAWDLYGLIAYPSRVYVQHASIAYRNPLTGNLWISLIYILATCGALLLSRYRLVRWYGVLNLVVLIIVEAIREYVFASVWCYYAAIMSALIFWHFRQAAKALPIAVPREAA